MKKKLFIIPFAIILSLLTLAACGLGKKEAKFIGDRSVQYDETNGTQTVFFAFYASENSDAMKQEADISITITNDDGTVVYDKVTHVTEDDYAEWTNAFSGTRLLGSVTINENEIEKGTTETGSIAIGATLPSGNGFEAESQYIYGLPLMDIDIATPALPVTVNNYGWEDALEQTISIDNIEFNYDFSCSATITATMTYNANGDIADDYVDVPYKIKDSDGVVVDSGTFFIGPLSVGDTVKTDTYVMGVELGKSYTIEFSDYRW